MGGGLSSCLILRRRRERVYQTSGFLSRYYVLLGQLYYHEVFLFRLQSKRLDEGVSRNV